MEKYDAQKAARVWQRVQAEQPRLASAPELQEMLEDEWLDGATYLLLAKPFQGPIREKLQKMGKDEQTHAACLRGIYTLTTGGHPTQKTKQVPPEAPHVILRRCYGREMRSLARYEAKSSDPQYGQVFLRLAEQEREHCKMILELLGSIPTVKK